MILHLHSYWAYLSLGILLVAVLNAILGLVSKNNYYSKDFRIALFTLIVMALQAVLGLATYFTSPAFERLKEIGMGAAMKDSNLRLLTVEHPMMMLLALLLVLFGFSKHNKKIKPNAKFKTILIYYGIALVFVLSRLPWQQWLNK